MNRQSGSNPPLRNISNMPPQSQNRATSQNSRLVPSKSGAWNSSVPLATQVLPQPHDNVNSWAQAMNTRTNTQLDLSSSAFPSLSGNSLQSQMPGTPSSQWQAGPPSREQSQAQNMRSIQRRQPLQNPSQRDPSFSNEAYSRTDFPGFEAQTARFQTHTPTTRGAPPGLALAGTVPDTPSGGASSQKSPISGANGIDRTNGDNDAPSPISANQQRQDSFPPRETMSPAPQHGQDVDTILSNMSDKDRYGMVGWAVMNDGPAAEYRASTRSHDIVSFEDQIHSGRPLLRSYAGPFARPDAHPPRPLPKDYHIPDCYIVQNVAPIQQRISGFTEDTLFYIFYTSPKDILQEDVATELMARKWRFHMKEKMWMTRDDTTANPIQLEKDVCEQGIYIWWDYRSWKRIRKQYVLRFEDLDDHLSGGRHLHLPGLFQGSHNGLGGTDGASQVGMNSFNAVPGLERMAALSGRF